MKLIKSIAAHIKALLPFVFLLTHTTTAKAQVITSWIINGFVFNDANGNVVKDTGEPGVNNTGSSNLYVYLIRNSTSLVVDSERVAASGTFLLSTTISPGGAIPYRIELSERRYAVGTNVSTTPIDKTLGSGWLHTGERAAITDSAADGSIIITTATADTIRLGIQRRPSADAKYYSIAKTAFSKIPPSGFPDISTSSDPWVIIPMNSPALSGYTPGGSLSGSDPEDCTTASSCNTGTGTTFLISSIHNNTRLFYDFGGATGVVELDTSGGPVTIANFDVAKMVIWGQAGAGTPGSELGFTYAIRDAAGATSTSVPYIIATATPLPVALLYFNAAGRNDQVVLEWATANEQNTVGFDIEYSSDAGNWRIIGFVAGSGQDAVPESTTTYSFSDNQPRAGSNLYRLKQRDLDGSYSYSPARLVHIGKTEDAIRVFPNPVREQLHISGLQGAEIIRIYDGTGSIRYQQIAGSDNMDIPFDTMNQGLYYIQIIDKNGAVSSHEVIKL